MSCPRSGQKNFFTLETLEMPLKFNITNLKLLKVRLK